MALKWSFRVCMSQVPIFHNLSSHIEATQFQQMSSFPTEQDSQVISILVSKSMEKLSSLHFTRLQAKNMQ